MQFYTQVMQLVVSSKALKNEEKLPWRRCESGFKGQFSSNNLTPYLAGVLVTLGIELESTNNYEYDHKTEWSEYRNEQKSHSPSS